MSGDTADGEKRKRGVISTADRKFLRKSEAERREDYTRQGRSDAWTRIRKRVKNAILDFTILFEELGKDELNQIFGRYPTPKSGRYSDPALEAGLRDILALVLESGGGEGLVLGHGNSPSHVTDIEADRLFREALKRLAWRHQYQIDTIDLVVEAEPIHWRELEQNLEAGDELSPEQLAHFLSRDDVDTSEIQDQVHSMVFDKSE